MITLFLPIQYALNIALRVKILLWLIFYSFDFMRIEVALEIIPCVTLVGRLSEESQLGSETHTTLVVYLSCTSVAAPRPFQNAILSLHIFNYIMLFLHILRIFHHIIYGKLHISLQKLNQRMIFLFLFAIITKIPDDATAIPDFPLPQ